MVKAITLFVLKIFLTYASGWGVICVSSGAVFLYGPTQKSQIVFAHFVRLTLWASCVATCTSRKRVLNPTSALLPVPTLISRDFVLATQI